MSKGWIIAAAVFFFLSCFLGAALMAGFKADGLEISEWTPGERARDAGPP